MKQRSLWTLLGLALWFALGLSAHADQERLQAALAAQPEEAQARYPWRNPAETLAFFRIEPGMTVVEVLPGGGWYSSILAAYLGPEGRLVGADYPLDIWPNFPFGTPEFVAKRRGWADEWLGKWAGEGKAALQAGVIGQLPDALDGAADALVFIRALHNLNRFESEGKGSFLTNALADAYAALKPGGFLGVVQHEAPPDQPLDAATGSRGYMNRDDLVQKLQAAGFELVAASDINANPADQPSATDIVWRLPPAS